VWFWRLMAHITLMYGVGKAIFVASGASLLGALRSSARQPLNCELSPRLWSPICAPLVSPKLSASVVVMATTDADKLEGGGAADLDEFPAGITPGGGV
jgi:hypothetical protein